MEKNYTTKKKSILNIKQFLLILVLVFIGLSTTTSYAQVVCGPVNTLYQTIGKLGATNLPNTRVYRYNAFQQSYIQVGTLQGSTGGAASNSAYNATTQYIYSSDGGSTVHVYDPSTPSYTYLGDITIPASFPSFNNTLFAYGNQVGFVNGTSVVLFDVTGLAYTNLSTSTPVNLTVGDVTEKTFPSQSGAPNDYSLIGDEIYGVNGSTLRVINISGASATVVNKTITFDETLGGGVVNDGSFGATWQDRNGNFYCFNNGNGAIYKITDILNQPATTATAVKVLLATSSGVNDGFGCEIGPDPLDWDDDTIENSIDIDDDNDGILDINESPLYPGIDPAGDADGDGVFNYRDADDPAIIGVSAFIDINGDTINDKFDFDLDGIPDSYDLDSDNDGIPDNVEAQSTLGFMSPSLIATFADADSDGLDDVYDNNLSGIPNSIGITPLVNTDGTGRPDYLDVDSDDDGLYDTVEAGITLSGLDSDLDGLDDAIDASIDVTIPNGTISIPSNLPDTDGDVNAPGGDVNYRDSSDIDGDGYLDAVDLDDDNDGIIDTTEYTVNQPFGDEDGDGIFNFADVVDNNILSDGSTTDYTDSNNDGVPDVFDFDLDGIVNHLDTDSDNDGCPDATEGANNLVTTATLVGGSNGGSSANLGTTVNTNGIPTAATGGTTAGTENTGQASAAGVTSKIINLTVDTDPVDETATSGSDVIFSGIASADEITAYAPVTTTDASSTITYQWQEDTGSGFADIVDGSLYSDTSSATLTITGVTTAMNGFDYQLVVTHPNSSCTIVTSISAKLTVTPSIIATIDNFGPFPEGTGGTSISVLGNDFLSGSTPTPSTVNLTLVGASPHAGIVLNANGTITVGAGVPPAVYTLNYQICDAANSGICSSTSVLITVADAGNPNAVDDGSLLVPLPVNEDSTTNTIDWDNNDSLIDGATLSSFDAISAHGTITDNMDGTFDYVPNPGYVGPDSFTYTICDNDSPTATCDTATVFINVVNVNDAPETDDVSASGLEDNTTGIAITLTGSDVDGTVANFNLSSLPANGTLYTDSGLGTAVATATDYAATLEALTFYFVPTSNWNGVTTFNYASVDNNSLQDATDATGTITVNAVNDAPVADDSVIGVLEESTNTPLGLSAPTDVDTAVNTLIIEVTGLPTLGTVTLGDGTPISDGDFLSIAQLTTLQYDAPLDYTTGDAVGNFTYTVSDGIAPAVTGTTTITVTAVNDAPETDDVSASGLEDNTTGIAITLTGSDVDGTVANFNLSSLPANGTLYTDSGLGTAVATATDYAATLEALTFYFVPTSNWNGVTTFNYASVDNNALIDSSPATGTITVSAVNDPPVAVTDDYSSTLEDISVVISPLTGDSDVEGPVTLVSINGDAITGAAQIITVPNGTVSITGAGVITFIPTPNYNGGPFSFPYVIKDSDGVTATANQTFTITAVNDLPIAVNDVYPDVLAGGGPINFNVLSNDDFGGDGPSVGPISVTALSITVGTVTVNDGGSANDPTNDTLDFTPASDYSGLVQISYTITDFDGDTSTATATFTIIPLAELEVKKTVDNATPNVGSVVEFVVTVTNNGPSNATGIDVVDQLPSGYAVDTVSPTTASHGTYDSDTGLWTGIDLADTEVATLTVYAVVQATGNYTNIAEVTSADQDDPNGIVHGNNTPGEVDQKEVTTTPVAQADIVTIKTDNSATYTAGTDVTYTISVTNNGPSDAVNVNVTDPLPSGITTSVWSGNNGSSGTGALANTIPLLTNGTTIDYSITLSVPSSFTGNLQNIATVTTTTPDPDPTCVSCTDTDTEAPSADIVTVKTDNSSTYTPGTDVTYTITVTNNGPSDAVNVNVTDALPAGLTAGDVVWAGNSASGTGALTNTIASLADGVSVVYTVTATIPSSFTGNLENIALVISTTPDPDPTCVGCTDTDTENALAELVLTKVVDNATPNVGSVVEFVVTVTNNGPSNATGIDVVDQLPSGYAVDTVSPTTASHGTYDSDTGLWTGIDLADTEVATLTVYAVVQATGNYTNIAEVTSADQDDPNGIVHGNNTPGEIDQDEVTTVPVAIIDLVTTKTVDNPTPNVDGEIKYTITVHNNGPSDATNVVVTDMLPTGVTFKEVEPAGTYNELTGLWTIGTILKDTSADITITATIDPGQGGNTITNVITTVTSTETDLSPTIDDPTATVTVTSSDLVTTKIVSDANPAEGDVIAYSIVVTNNGPSDATGVSLIDLLPAGVTYVSDNFNNVAIYNSGDGNWVIGDLASTNSVTLTISALVDAGTASSTITNITTVAGGDQEDPTTASDTLEASINVENQSDIVLTKVVDNETPNTGDTVTYTVTVTNAGPALVTNLVVEDVLPVGLSEGIVSASTGLWSAPYWTIGTLASGTTETLTIEAEVTALGTIPQIGLVNTVSNTQDQIDSNLLSDSPTATVTVTASDLETTKEVSDANPAEGDVIDYTIVVTNNGPSPATGVSLIDLLPDGVTYVSDNFDDVAIYNSGDGNWVIGDLAATSSVTLTISALVDAGTASSTITNITTAASGDQTDPLSDDDLEAEITVQNFSDIVLTKVVDNETPNTGDTVTYTITVTNAGPAAVTNLVVEDQMPVGLDITGVDAGPGTWSSPYWTVGTLASGTTATLIIKAKVTALGTIPQVGLVNTVSNTQDQIDSNLLPDNPTATVTVTASDLETTKEVSDANPSEGDVIDYTIVVTNNGPSPATGVSLIDLLPDGVTYVSDNFDDVAIYNSGDGNWVIGDLAATSSVTLTISALVDAGTASSTITNITTAASGDQTDPLSDDDLEATITVQNLSDIILTKVVDNNTPNVGDTITYTITVANNGSATATNLRISDLLPAGLTFGLTSPSKGIWSAPYWTIGTLLEGEKETITIEAMVGMDQGGKTLVNTVVNTQDQVDSNVTPDDNTETIRVTSSDLITVKTVSDENPLEGATIVYSIAVTNRGFSPATGVSLTDVLPIGVTYVSNNQGDSFNSGSGIWTIGDLAVNATITLNITATVDEGTAGSSITNLSTRAIGDQSDPTIVGDDLEATIDISNFTDVVVTKVVDNVTPNEGDTVRYTITVTNNGPAVVTNLVITDTLPVGVEESLVTPSNGSWTAPEWNIAELAVGVTETITIEAIVTAEGTLAQLPITNIVSNTQDQDDSNLIEDDLEADITVTASNLVTVKTVSDETPAEGDTITYTIAVTNNGPSNATSVSLVDLLPIGVTYVSDNANGAYNGGDGNWMIGELASNATVTLEIMASVDEETAGLTVTNTTTAAIGDQTDPTAVGDDLEATIVVEDDADIVLTKVVDNATPNAGETVTYTITVTNNGPANATNLVVTDALPAGLKYGSIISPSIGTWTAPNWILGNLASGKSETIVIEAIVGLDQGGNTLVNTVSNSQDQMDSDLTVDDASETIVITNSDLGTLKTVSNAFPNEGDTITYTIQVTNNGPSNATNVSLVDKLPVGVTYVSHTSGAGTYNFGSGLWNIGNVSNGSTVMLNIVATVDDGTLGQTITNSTSALIADQSDSDNTNNIGSVSIVPTAYIDLSLTKTVVDDVVAPEVGDTITFEIRVNNEGPTEATGVQVTDLIPTGYDFVNYSSSIGTYNPITGVWNIGFIEIGNTAVLLVDVIVMDSGEYNNCAEITAANEIDIDSTPDNANTSEDDYDCASAPPIQILDLRIEKTVIADNLSPLVDTEVSFEIRVINDGNIEATEVVVTDLLPSGYTYLNYSSSRGTYDDDSGLWKIGRIVDGEVEILIIDAIVNATGDYLNCAAITEMHQIDPDLSNNTSCTATDPIPVADLELTKEVALSDGTSGPVSTIGVLQPYAESNVDFTITLTNNGPSDATGVQVIDLLPNGYNFVSVSETSGIYDDGSGIWNVGTIAKGTSETIIITVYVNPVGDWLNVAEVIAVNELDLDSTPNNGDIFEDDMDQVSTDPIVLLTIAEGFTPNGDGINDVFEIEFLEVLYPNFGMEIVDRYGNLVYEYKHNGNPYQTPDWWNGFSGGRMNFSSDALPAGTYFYTIYFNNDERKPQNGWVYLRK